MKALLGVLGAVIVAILLAAGPAAANVIIFSDNFDSENGGSDARNYNAFANWNVTEGTVDLLGAKLGDLCTGAGGAPVCVDLDGSTQDAGIMTTKNAFTFQAEQDYVFSFDLAGSQRGDVNEVTVSFLGFDFPFTMQSSDPFTTFEFFILIGPFDLMSTISFSNFGGDNIGALLDNVVLTQITEEVPEPAIFSLFTTGLFSALRLRRRKLGNVG